MEKKESLEKRKKKIRGKIEGLLKKKETYIFYALIAFTIIFKLYYFFKTMDQAVWWDEGDYLAIAKEFIINRELPEWWSHFTAIRPLVMPFIWAFTFLINLPETVIRFITLLLPSIVTIILTYKIGKDMYNKKIGLIAMSMLSVYWVHHFYTYRFLTDVPAFFFGVLSIYFFWSKYITEGKNIGLHLAAVFGVIAFATRFPLALVPISIYLYLLITRGFKILKDKTIWKSIGWGVLTLSPYIIYFIITKFRLFSFYFGAEAVDMQKPLSESFKNILPLIPDLTMGVWFICMIIGILTLYKLIIGFDLVLKQKTKKLNADLFLVLIALTNLLFYLFIARAANDRWLLMLIFPLFILSSKGITTIGDFIKKYSKPIATLAILVLVVWGMSQHINHGHQLTVSKIDSYKEEKLAGLWLKENTPEDAKIIISSIVQNQYYSERQSYDFYNKETPYPECYDIYGKLLETEECQTKTEEAFRKKIKDIDADYLVIHIFEPVFTPQWAYTYPDRHKDELEPVQGYFNQNQQPILVIYKFNKSAEVFN